ncbi:MAG: chromate transporter [Clostridium sp.]|nr:chromate transporter [Clostridium sp.]
MQNSPTAGSGRSHTGKASLLWKIFISTLYLSAFTFGGGYVIVTLMKKKFVDQYHWIDQEEMLDLVAIAQSSPGPIAVNGAIVVGYKLAGLAGVITAVAGTVLPPFTILTLISFCYAAFRSNQIVGWMLNGMQAGVGAVIAQVVWEMGCGVARSGQISALFIMAAAFAASYVYQVNTILIILVCALIGIVRSLYESRKAGAGKGDSQ